MFSPFFFFVLPSLSIFFIGFVIGLSYSWIILDSRVVLVVFFYLLIFFLLCFLVAILLSWNWDSYSLKNQKDIIGVFWSLSLIFLSLLYMLILDGVLLIEITKFYAIHYFLFFIMKGYGILMLIFGSFFILFKIPLYQFYSNFRYFRLRRYWKVRVLLWVLICFFLTFLFSYLVYSDWLWFVNKVIIFQAENQKLKRVTEMMVKLDNLGLLDEVTSSDPPLWFSFLRFSITSVSFVLIFYILFFSDD